eukprot:scaffold28222_cov89-Phaeocystis_antarctica.AAC.4
MVPQAGSRSPSRRESNSDGPTVLCEADDVRADAISRPGPKLKVHRTLPSTETGGAGVDAGDGGTVCMYRRLARARASLRYCAYEP